MTINKTKEGYPCNKARTLAILITPNNDLIITENRKKKRIMEWKTNRELCPRTEAKYEDGKGYELCKVECQTYGHSEEIAIKTGIEIFGEDIVRQSQLISIGHRIPCEGCSDLMKKYGIEPIVVTIEELRLIK